MATQRLVYLVSGANRGIGREVVRQIARNRPHSVVILTARDTTLGEQARDELNKELSGNVVAFHQLDVKDLNSSKTLADWVKSQYGGLDVLINNAGYATSGSGVDEQMARETIGTNFNGVKNVTSQLLPLIRPGGRVIIVSSSLGVLGDSFSANLKARFLDPDVTEAKLDALAAEFITDVQNNTYTQHGWPASTYQVSKVLVNAYLRMLNKDYGNDGRNLFFATCCPGWVRTRMGGEKAPLNVEQGGVTPVYLATEDPSKMTNGVFWIDKNVTSW